MVIFFGNVYIMAANGLAFGMEDRVISNSDSSADCMTVNILLHILQSHFLSCKIFD
jgi:hypothetical protein